MAQTCHNRCCDQDLKGDLQKQTVMIKMKLWVQRVSPVGFDCPSLKRNAMGSKAGWQQGDQLPLLVNV